MEEALAVDVLISEVGPRDGLQSVKSVMPTERKQQWISALAAAGLKEIEVGSFVSAKALPQMADCAAVVAHALTIPNLRVAVLVPNLRYAEMAFAAGAHMITIPVSVSEPHSISNIRKNHAEIIADVRAIVKLRNELYPKTEIEGGLATAFGCTIQGVVPEADTVRMAVTLAECGVHTIGLADTVGVANPAQVRRVFKSVRGAVGNKCNSAHLHNTRGQGLANVVAALDVDIRVFDSSQGGIGGCPYAPGATGNIVTEDLVFLLEAMGLRTGIDIGRLLEARKVLAQGLPAETLYGYLPDAGLPKGFVPASSDASSGGVRDASPQRPEVRMQ